MREMRSPVKAIGGRKAIVAKAGEVFEGWKRRWQRPGKLVLI